MSPYSPCRPPHPHLAQSHIAPPHATIAVLALVYSDTAGVITPDLVNSWYGGPALDYIARVSGGCTTVSLRPFVVPLSEAEKDTDGNCRPHGADWQKLAIPAIPDYTPSDYFSTHIMPVSQTCATSGAVGGFTISIAGVETSFASALGMGHTRAHESFSQTNRYGEERGFSSVYVHELVHLLGAGYHSNAYKCDNPTLDQADILACPSYEYGDLYDILGSSQGFGANLNAFIRYNLGWLGRDNITVVKTRGSHALAPINAANTGGGGAKGLPVAAFVPSVGLSIEWRSGMDTAEAGAMLAANPGFFVRRGATHSAQLPVHSVHSSQCIQCTVHHTQAAALRVCCRCAAGRT